MSLLFLGIADRFALNDLQLFSYMVPVVVAGFYLSKYAIGFIDKNISKKLRLAYYIWPPLS